MKHVELLTEATATVSTNDCSVQIDRVNDVYDDKIVQSSLDESGINAIRTPAIEGLSVRSWRGIVEALRSDPDDLDGEFTPVLKRRQQPRLSTLISRQPMIRGKRIDTEQLQVKAAPRQLAAFVGRLHKDTTVENLTAYLSEAGIVNPRCRKLEAKTGKSFSTAAFKVMCDESCRNTFYNEASWPEGVELRDWFYRTK